MTKYTVVDVARKLGRTEAGIRTAIYTGRIKCRRDPDLHRIYFTEADLEGLRSRKRA